MKKKLISFLRPVDKLFFVCSILMLILAGFFILTDHMGVSLKFLELVFIISFLGLVSYMGDFVRKRGTKKK